MCLYMCLYVCDVFYITSPQELVPTSDSNVVRSLMYMFEILMKEASEDEKTARDNKNLKIWIVVGQC